MIWGASSISDAFDPTKPRRGVAGGLARSVVSTPDTPLIEPVGTKELKTFARVDDDATGELQRFAKAAREFLETALGLALVPTTVTALIEGPSDDVRVPRTPIGSITTCRLIYRGTAESDIASEYYIEGDRIHRTNARAIPAGYTLELVYDAGYDPADVPEDIRRVIKTLAAAYYDAEGMQQAGNAAIAELSHYMR